MQRAIGARQERQPHNEADRLSHAELSFFSDSDLVAMEHSEIDWPYWRTRLRS